MLYRSSHHGQSAADMARSAQPEPTRRPMTETVFIPGPDTTRAYRDALGRFGTGITVITTQTADGPLAMTANSFASVSLDPPLVLWCAAKKSQRYRAFTEAATYAIHILAEDQRPLAEHFARSGLEFDAIDWHRSDTGLPVLGGCIARFECRRSALHDAGDHTIIVGEVERAALRSGRGLLHKGGQYGTFAPRG